MNRYEAKIYTAETPNPTVTHADASRKDIAICFSGGGSRALTCAWGQMIGLSRVLEDGSTPLMDQVRYISSVSGGTWASLLYTFRPETITDQDFLGDCYHPSQLYYGEDHAGGFNVNNMGALALGKIPQNFSNLSALEPEKNIFVEFIAITVLKGIPLSDSLRWLWMYIVAKNVLTDFGLYNFENSVFHPTATPWNYPQAKYFSLSQAYATAHIFSESTSAPPKDAFVYARTIDGKSAGPMLIMNTNVIGVPPVDIIMSGPVQIPVQVSPVAAGVFGRNPYSTDAIGGGSVESFGFSSTLESVAGAGQVTSIFPRTYSLADIASCSSAFYAAFAADLLESVLNALDIKSDEELHSHFSGFLHFGEELITKQIRSHLSASDNKRFGIDDLVPRYNYWPLGSPLSDAAENRNIEFTDGGDLENTGVAGLLTQAQGSVGNIISFVNGAEVLEMKGDQIIAATQMAPLFGIAYEINEGLFMPYHANGVNPFTGLVDPAGFLQIFDNSEGEFDALRHGLYQANGSGSKSDPAFFRQTLKVVKNTLYGITNSRLVNLLWVQNAVVKKWQDQIIDTTLRQKIKDGQVQGGRLEFANFPYYSTSEKIYATAAETNTLAQMWAWNVADLQSPLSAAIVQMFAES